MQPYKTAHTQPHTHTHKKPYEHIKDLTHMYAPHVYSHMNIYNNRIHAPTFTNMQPYEHIQYTHMLIHWYSHTHIYAAI